MAKPYDAPRMSEAHYLAWETSQPRRHEYVQGRIYAIHEAADPAGVDAADPRAAVALNLAAALRAHLGGTASRVYVGDLRLDLPGGAAHLYPDIVVSALGAFSGRGSPALRPVLIVDVPSPTAGSRYPGVRFAHYRRLPSLREYMLVDARRRRVDLYRRGADGLWVLQPWEPGAEVPLASLGLRLPAAVLFGGPA